MARVQLEGVDELMRKLGALDDELRGEALLEAAQAGADMVADLAGQLAPRDSGELSEGIEAEVARADANQVVLAVGPTKDVFYGRFQELGTSYHPAQPFLRPAMDAMEDDVIEEVKDRLRARVLRVARRGA